MQQISGTLTFVISDHFTYSVWECRSVLGCARICAVVSRYVQVCVGVCKYTQACTGVQRGGQKWLGVCECVCVWDEFSEYLLENSLYQGLYISGL